MPDDKEQEPVLIVKILGFIDRNKDLPQLPQVEHPILDGIQTVAEIGDIFSVDKTLGSILTILEKFVAAADKLSQVCIIYHSFSFYVDKVYVSSR